MQDFQKDFLAKLRKADLATFKSVEPVFHNLTLGASGVSIGRTLATIEEKLGPRWWKEWRMQCGIPPEKLQTYMGLYSVAQQQGLPDKLLEAFGANHIDIVVPSYVNPYGKYTPVIQAFPWKGRIDDKSTYEECVEYVIELKAHYDDFVREEIKQRRERREKDDDKSVDELIATFQRALRTAEKAVKKLPVKSIPLAAQLADRELPRLLGHLGRALTNRKGDL